MRFFIAQNFVYSEIFQQICNTNLQIKQYI